MSAQTHDRNYRKNPHTATFLRTFHSGIPSTGRDYRAEMPVAERDRTMDVDLLDLVPVDVIADLRSPAQADLMQRLIIQLDGLDGEVAIKAADYTRGMTEHGKWTPGYEGNASAWISRMIAKVDELKAAAPAPVSTGTATTIPAGRYAVETDEIRCYSVEYGKEGTRWAGFTFLNRISSDDRFPIKNPAEKARILDAIRADVAASALLAALTLRQCIRCGRTLSDTKNPYFAQGLGPDCGSK